MTAKIYGITAIAVGGAIGTLLRYNLNVKIFSDFMPYATIFENVTGSFLLGILIGWLIHRRLPEWLRLGLTVGLLGGFTTMSTLAADTISISTMISTLDALKYISISLVGGITMAFVGFALGNMIGINKNPSGWEDNLK